MNELMQAWFNLLNGLITYNSLPVNVYVGDIPMDQPQNTSISPHYVWIHAEGSSDGSTKQVFFDDDVIIVDIVSVVNNNMDVSIVSSIDKQIRQLLYSSPSICNLSTSSPTVQFGQTVRENVTYITEDDGVNKYYRKVSRYKTTVLHTI